MPNQSDDTFYPDLPYFEEFGAFTDETLFRSVPEDWHVIIADIRNSTRAVAEGRYKHVNIVGTACITASLNAVRKAAGETTEIPYSFGGDGATLLVPDILLSCVRKALMASALMAQREFGFDLRIGSVSVKEIRAQGRDVTVSKLRLSPGNELALFGGGGIFLADSLIKSDDLGENGYLFVSDGDEGEADMTGLSCRWEPLKSRNGQVLSLMLYATSESGAQRRKIYDRVLAKISEILGGDLKSASPVTADTMRFKWIPQGLRMEAQLTRGAQSFARRLMFLLYQSFIQYILERCNLAVGDYNAPTYREEVRANSDYRRFDDVLRFVLDCSQTQIQAIEDLLTKERQAGAIAYGLHKSDTALMTCLVFNLEQSEHLHFIDGGDGGFTKASVQFKQQLKAG
ncbi:MULTISPECIES: DUF3095 domain-containing protein [unclassified Hwanghaeella]|jgi:hypothetical protein|uniref:DUF3095 domain-containing protein n=1 Tax=unclassified Hwanghaeella TaxID=2605944 RepID=UPI000C914B2A|nr:hypothetical protein [Rhodospirillales bacterium]|tara:strand:- start:3774 stop:4973 length:1200 start_codon:yes stop_codon:yes gene_type:complete